MEWGWRDLHRRHESKPALAVRWLQNQLTDDWSFLIRSPGDPVWTEAAAASVRLTTWPLIICQHMDPSASAKHLPRHTAGSLLGLFSSLVFGLLVLIWIWSRRGGKANRQEEIKKWKHRTLLFREAGRRCLFFKHNITNMRSFDGRFVCLSPRKQNLLMQISLFRFRMKTDEVKSSRKVSK